MSYLLNKAPTLGMGLLALYLGLAPVHDLLGTAQGELLVFKWILVAGGTIAVLVPAFLQGRLTLPGGIWGPVGFAGLAALSIPGIIQAPVWQSSLMFLSDIAYAAVLLWCFFWLARDNASGDNASCERATASAVITYTNEHSAAHIDIWGTAGMLRLELQSRALVN